MPKPENVINNGFKQNPGNINKEGRPKKIYTILKEHGYSADDVRIAFGEMAWYTLADLKEVHSDENKPVITRIVANQFYLALQKGDWSKVKEILEHVIGKPTQTINAKVGTQKADLESIFPTDDELNEQTDK